MKANAKLILKSVNNCFNAYVRTNTITARFISVTKNGVKTIGGNLIKWNEIQSVYNQ